MIRAHRLSRIIECLGCGAPVWERCTSANGKPLDVVHQIRVKAAKKAAKKKGSATGAMSPFKINCIAEEAKARSAVPGELGK